MAVLFLATSAPGLPVSLPPHRVSLCCHTSQSGALGALRESGCCGRAVGSGCWALAAGRIPHHDKAPPNSPRQLDGHLQPASTQALPVSHGLVPASESGCRRGFSSPPDIWIPPCLLRAGSWGWWRKEECCGRRGKEGRTDAPLAITSTPSYHHSNLMIKNNPRLERKHV